MSPDYDDEPSEMELDATATETPKGITITIHEYALEGMGRTVAAEVSERVGQMAIRSIEKKLSILVDEAVRKVIGDRAEALIIEYLEKPRQKFNEWGTPTGPVITFAEQIPNVVDQWLKQTVNEKGSPSTYSGDERRSRASWIIASHVKADIDTAINGAVQNITKQARDIVAQKIAAFVSEQMVPAIEMKR